MENNSIHNSSVHAGVSTIQNSLIPKNLSILFHQFFRHLREYWPNFFSVRITDTILDKLNREIYYHITIRSHIIEMSFDDVDLAWKKFKDIFEISENPIDEKIYSELSHLNDEFKVSRFRYDESDFELRVNLIAFNKFLYERYNSSSSKLSNISSLLVYAITIIETKFSKNLDSREARMKRAFELVKFVSRNCRNSGKVLRNYNETPSVFETPLQLTVL